MIWRLVTYYTTFWELRQLRVIRQPREPWKVCRPNHQCQSSFPRLYSTPTPRFSEIPNASTTWSSTLTKWKTLQHSSDSPSSGKYCVYKWHIYLPGKPYGHFFWPYGFGPYFLTIMFFRQIRPPKTTYRVLCPHVFWSERIVGDLSEEVRPRICFWGIIWWC